MTNITIPRALLMRAVDFIQAYALKAAKLNDQDHINGNAVKAHKMLMALAGVYDCYEPQLNDAFKTLRTALAESEKQENQPLVLTEVIEDGGHYIDENGNKHELNNIHVYKPAYEKSDNYIHKEPSVRNLIHKDEELARELAQTILQCGYRRQPNEPWDLEEKICASWIIKAFAKVREDAVDGDLAWRVWMLAFLEGAKFWEWHKTKATMWQSDQKLCYEEAIKRHNQFAKICKEYEK